MKKLGLGIVLAAASLSIAVIAQAAGASIAQRVATLGAEAGLEVPAAVSFAAIPEPAPKNASSRSAGSAVKALLEPFAAEPLPQSASDSSRFSTLGDLYSRGAMPTEADLTGWYAGRCYNSNTPDTPEGDLLVGRRQAKGSENDNGPLFPPNTEFYITTVVSFRGVSYLDDLTQAKINEITRIIDFEEITPATPVSGALASQYGPGNLEFRLRKSGELLIESAVVLRDEAERKSGDIASLCYFFKKVHD